MSVQPRPMMRKCVKCGLNRNVHRFTSARGRTCDTCRRASRRRGGKDARLQEDYGITMEQWERLLAYNEGRCWICDGVRKGKGGGPAYDTDHDHALERQGTPTEYTVRGLLCKQCNRRLLPSCKDSIRILERAIWYLLNAHRVAQEILWGDMSQDEYGGGSSTYVSPEE